MVVVVVEERSFLLVMLLSPPPPLSLLPPFAPCLFQFQDGYEKQVGSLSVRSGSWGRRKEEREGGQKNVGRRGGFFWKGGQTGILRRRWRRLRVESTSKPLENLLLSSICHNMSLSRKKKRMLQKKNLYYIHTCCTPRRTRLATCKVFFN